MKVAQLKLATLVVVLGAAIAANPPPGEVLGREVGMVAWVAVLAVGLVGGVLTLALAGRPGALVGAALMFAPLLGPVADLASASFFAVAVGAWAFALHLELMSFARRKARWARLLGDDPSAVDAYEGAYVGQFWRLAGATSVGLALVIGAYMLLRAMAPSTFSLSLEARHVEGLAAFLVLVVALVAAIVLLTRRPAAATPADAAETPPPESSP